ncbi:MAG: HAMP domain-containing histidine kinase [Muribaculaceae bacterium]|nr:HAMP domain-containing histidine kinase [Muribaculaceae bacterium]
MALKKRISYQWQLFIPLVFTMWAIIIGMAYWKYYDEQRYRKQQLDEQLGLINQRIIDAYESGVDVVPFLDFIYTYYKENPLYDLIRVSVYEDKVPRGLRGEPIALSKAEREKESGFTRTPGVEEEPDKSLGHNDYFFYRYSHSTDGKLEVYTVLPFDNDILSASLPSSSVMWIVLILAGAVTVLSYFSTRYFGRNITILRTVAERAATDPNFIPAMDYPHDELGDISRQIIHMYNERSQAMQKQKREHIIAMHAIEEKARAKRQLTNNINHELRTPIGVIKGYLDTILDNPDMDETSRTHFLTKAQEHVNRLVNLIADVSAITRLEEGSDMISTEELDFHDIAYTIANDLEESGTLGKMEFTYEIPLDCKINGNYNLLSGMIINLAKNSGAYSKGSHCDLSLVDENDKFYIFEFSDDGIGVSEEHIPHLFERFYRIDSGRTRKAGGTGLGLPIVQSTVIAHGGTIDVFNGKMGGLTFRFSLPKYRPGR